MDEAIEVILQNLIYVVFSAAGGFLTAYLKAHYSAQKLRTAEAVAVEAVRFAEQVAGALGYDPKKKLHHALDYVQQLGGRLGIRLTEEQWVGLIESAVLHLKKEVAA